MTPVVPPAAGVSVNPGVGSQSQPSSSQNLFEHMAEQAKTSSHGTSPSELGGDLMHNLDGFVERNNAFDKASKTDQPLSKDPANRLNSFKSSGASTVSGADAANGQSLLQDGEMDKLIQAMDMTYNHATETMMVSQGLTQLTGAAKSLLRGR